MIRNMYALVDCNNFFASCERAGDPALDGKPIAVLSNNDGNVIARSAEVKALGIKMGMPTHELKPMIKKHDIEVFSSNYQLYGDLSDRVFHILNEFSPETERYSIDEVFQKYFGFEVDSLKNRGQAMVKKVRRNTGIPICVGFAPTKALAKIANKIAKKNSKRLGSVCVIDTDEKRDWALKWCPIEDVWGIGRAHAGRLKNLGVHTAYDFVTKMNSSWVRKNMSVVGLRLYNDLKGKSSLFFEDIKPKKGIMTSRSFETYTDDYDYVRERVYTYAVWAAEKLRKEKGRCGLIEVSLDTNFYRENQAQYFPRRYVETDFPTNSTLEIAKFAMIAFEQAYRPGYIFKKAGVFLTDITPEANSQLALFNTENPKEATLMKVIDRINAHQGKHAVMFGAMDHKKLIKMKAARISKRFTTQWDEKIIINCNS